MQGLIAIIVGVLPFLWLFHAFEMVSLAISLPIFFVCIGLLVIGIVLKTRHRSGSAKVRGARIAQTAKQAILANIHMLAVNQRNLVKLDDYGNEDHSAVLRDMGRFVDNNIAKKLGIELTEREQKKLFEIIRKEASRYRRNNASLFVEYDHAMTQAEYEAYCETLLKVDGWKTRLLPQAERPEGIDLVGEKDGMVVAFQIRKAERPVGNRGVNRIHDAKEGVGATHAVVIANEPFVTSARQLASELGVELWHHSDIGEGFR
ncbi:MAG: restriction endonuclease [Magnetococcales bacterium]|nr:restriction endonuclease [Magnetococcales bacterium]